MKRMIGLALVCPLSLAVACGDDDGGTDAGPRIDVGVARDSGPGRDAGAGRDAAMPDSGSPDSGGGTCGDLGEACTDVCPRSAFCQGEIAADRATGDTIDNLPEGADTSVVYFAGGYCTPDDLSGASMRFCDPSDPEDTTCGDCGVCVDFGVDTMCLRKCEPTNVDNSDCRDGYQCSLNAEGCLFGCSSDVDCNITRQETNGVPGLQAPEDCEANPAMCGGDAMNYDHLVYDTSEAATCNTDTYRCEFEGPPDAEAGIPCTKDTDCESNGFCITVDGWSGGYCSKFRCDIDGRSCANGGECQDRGLGISLCVGGCTVGTGMGVDAADPDTWRVAEGGCREGYTCFWDGESGAGVDGNGGCVPGEFNDVTTPNVGGPCDTDADCWSPFGRGFCIGATTDAGEPTGFAEGYCTVRDCQAPGLPAGICGDGGTCVGGFDRDDPTFALCLDECTTPEDCRDGYGCLEVAAGTKACFAGCSADTDCKATQRCDIPTGAMVGSCVDR